VRTPSPGDTSLVILASEEASRKIDEWRRKHDVHYRIVPPHITVAYPPFVPEEAWSTVRPFLVGLFSEFEPFTVTLAELDAFAEEDHVLWLKPEDRGTAKRIRSLLVESLSGYVAELPLEYVPHLTVGFFNSREELLAARDSIASEITPLRFRVEDMAYMVVDRDGVARVRDRVPLGAATRRVPAGWPRSGERGQPEARPAHGWRGM
jgi:2'-5' RNA ligase